MPIRAVLSVKAISSRLRPYTVINKAAILPKTKSVKRPINGEKITGRRTGRLVTSRIVEKGWKVKPSRVLVQM